jgi:hypothetical protein
MCNSESSSKAKHLGADEVVNAASEPIAQAKLRHYGRSAGYQLRVLNA